MSAPELTPTSAEPASWPARRDRRALYHVPVYRVSLVRDGSLTGEGPRPGLRTPEEMARMLLDVGVIPDDGREHFGAAFLDVRHRLIGLHEVSIGCLTSSLVHPREVFGPALVACAAALVVYHNHPSGDPEPSADDLALTRRLQAGGQLLGVELLDHLILAPHNVAAPRYVSLKQRGVL